MARPTTITDKQILDAAREVFLRQGARATTAAIARRAKISEGSIFKRFHTKEELFFSAMGMSQGPEKMVALIEKLKGTGDLRKNLGAVCLELLDVLQDLVPKLFMVWSSGLTPRPNQAPAPGEYAPKSAPTRFIAALVQLMRHEMKLGRMRACDPEAVARTLVGALFQYVVSSIMMPELPVLEPHAFAASLVEVLWNGIAPTPD